MFHEYTKFAILVQDCSLNHDESNLLEFSLKLSFFFKYLT